MIKGIGIDLIELERLDKAIKKNEKFLEKIFSKAELSFIESRSYNKSTISGIFSSKEAVSKALGTGISGFDWKDIEISHTSLGKPIVELKGKAKELSDRLGISAISLSISHDKEKAVSIAIAEGDSETYKSSNLEVMSELLCKRNEKSHKGNFGRVGVVAGSRGMSGAPFLSSSAALRTGSGLVYSLVPSSISEIVEIKSVEAIVISFDDSGTGHFREDNLEDMLQYLYKLDVVAIGPGIGADRDRVELVRGILSNIDECVVVDADGLNCVAKSKEMLFNRQAPTVLTPHEEEFRRLLEGEEFYTKDLETNREIFSIEFAKKYNVILVLKGHNTIVCDGEEIYINSTGNAGMATAGSGDVLTGMITSLIGQGIETFSATKLAVFLHGLSGDIARDEKGEYGLIARDIIESIPYAIKKLEGERK